MKNQTKLKLWIKLTIIFSSVMLGLGVILGSAIGYFRLPVLSYYRASEKAFVIPEINSGYIAQGLCYDEQSESFILSGYMNDKSPSPLYSVSKDGEFIKKITLLKPNGKDYKGHGGGVACHGEYIYLTGGSDKCIYVYSLTEFLSAKDGDKLECKGEIPLVATNDQNDYVGSAFVTACDNRLIVGEFYRAGNYPTPESHKLTTSAGDYNQALAVEFEFDGEQPFGVNPNPTKAYSLPDKVQGLTIYDNKIYLSTSWGLSFSHILEYDQAKLERQEDITLLGKSLPLYALDSQSLVNDYKIPPMSEEIVFVDGKLYVNCESASDKYIFGKLTGGKYLYKTDLTKLSK